MHRSGEAIRLASARQAPGRGRPRHHRAPLAAGAGASAGGQSTAKGSGRQGLGLPWGSQTQSNERRALGRRNMIRPSVGDLIADKAEEKYYYTLLLSKVRLFGALLVFAFIALAQNHLTQRAFSGNANPGSTRSLFSFGLSGRTGCRESRPRSTRRPMIQYAVSRMPTPPRARLGFGSSTAKRSTKFAGQSR
jgi:hypothetical protein